MLVKRIVKSGNLYHIRGTIHLFCSERCSIREFKFELWKWRAGCQKFQVKSFVSSPFGGNLILIIILFEIIQIMLCQLSSCTIIVKLDPGYFLKHYMLSSRISLFMLPDLFQPYDMKCGF